MDLDKLNIIKELGYGYNATVYLVEYKNKLYAYKIEKISEKNIPFIDEEINFSLKFANKYNTQFIKLYKYDIIDNCTHKQKLKSKLENLSEKQIEKRKSKYCFIRLYSLVDTTLGDRNLKLDQNQVYSLIIQMSYINYLLHKYKYYYGDLNLANIGVVKTNKKNIKIMNKNIPTFGYIYKVIDFGSVRKISKDSNNTNNLYELNQFISYYLIDYNKLYSKSHKLKINIFDNSFNDIFLQSEEYNVIKLYTDDESLQMTLYTIIYPEKYQKMVFGSKYNNKVIYPTLRCSINDILFLIKNKYKINSIIKYFIQIIKTFDDLTKCYK